MINVGQLLEERRRQMRQDVQSRMRVGRTDRPAEVGDSGKTAEVGVQEAVEFTLLESKREALERVDVRGSTSQSFFGCNPL
jgi:hypothetical protein